MRYIFLLLTVGLAHNIYSQSCQPGVQGYQTIYTRNGTAVEGTIYNQLSSQCYSDALNFVQNSYPNATIQENPTSEYNCYSYAFHLSEGNTQRVWINPYYNN